MDQLILHHFDISPFAEKIRTVMGLKQLAWHSVQIPIILPKPDLMPLTGGYRKTPVLQIGADIYCDRTRTAYGNGTGIGFWRLPGAPSPRPAAGSLLATRYRSGWVSRS